MKAYKFIFGTAFTLGLAGILPASAQWVNNGADVFIASTAQVMVNNTDYVHQSGDVELQGWLGLNGNWENNDASSLALNPAGTGTVEFSGIDQNFGGTNKTQFYNLLLSGAGIKTMNIDQEVSNTLDLTDRELALQNFNLSVTGTALDAIKRSSGFISSISTQGAIIRNTSLAGEYLFPTGSTLGATARYRPVILTIPTAADARLAVSFANSDPNANGLPRDVLGQGLTDINPNFYHRIERLAGTTPFDISMLYNDADGGFKEMAYWENTGWKNLNKTTLTTANYGDGLTSRITKSSVDLMGIQYFALANGKGTNFLTIPTAFSPNGDGMNDLFLIGGLDGYPDNEVRILNRWGDELYYKKSYSSSNAFDGAGFDPGTYYYVVKVNLNGQVRSFAGYITLLR